MSILDGKDVSFTGHYAEYNPTRLTDENGHDYYTHPKNVVSEATVKSMTDVLDDSGFVKYDLGKPQLFMSIIPDIDEEVARVMEHGASKYGWDNWHKCNDPTRYANALVRHTADLKEHGFSHRDKESNCLSIAHVVANARMLGSLVLRQEDAMSEVQKSEK